jgi:hypothetical protein
MPERAVSKSLPPRRNNPEKAGQVLERLELAPDAMAAIRYGLGLPHGPHRLCPCIGCFRAFGLIP